MESENIGSNEENAKPTKKQSAWEMVRFIILALIIVIPIRIFVAQPFVVSGSSMYPTFQNGDYLIVDELSYRTGDPQRYDVVVFHYPLDPSKFFIKRVIGLPGETVKILGNNITIVNKDHPEGFQIPEPFVKNPGDNDMTFNLKEGQYFVMGDNRSASSDSRSWGAVPRDLMSGRVLVRLLPLNDLGIMPGEYKAASLPGQTK